MNNEQEFNVGDKVWQPIKSAPKDGTPVLLFVQSQVIEGQWLREMWRYAILSEHGCGCCAETGDAPTHWMPLPQPPAGDEQ